jgi:ferredoxin--NADP+ reductase
MSLIRDPDIYERFENVVVVHSVRRVSDLAYRTVLEARLAEDPLVDQMAAEKLHYIPTVTREEFGTRGRIGTLVENGQLFEHIPDRSICFDPERDRIMLCGSMAMIKETAEMLEKLGFTEGSNNRPGNFVIERAFVD